MVVSGFEPQPGQYMNVGHDKKISWRTNAVVCNIQRSETPLSNRWLKRGTNYYIYLSNYVCTYHRHSILVSNSALLCKYYKESVIVQLLNVIISNSSDNSTKQNIRRLKLMYFLISISKQILTISIFYRNRVVDELQFTRFVYSRRQNFQC